VGKFSRWDDFVPAFQVTKNVTAVKFQFFEPPMKTEMVQKSRVKFPDTYNKETAANNYLGC